jgi:serine/threonine protein kinase
MRSDVLVLSPLFLSSFFAQISKQPENILIDHEGHIKLVDFGFAKEPDSNGRCFSSIGTPQYLSPEILAKKEGYAITSASTFFVAKFAPIEKRNEIHESQFDIGTLLL